MPCCRWGARRRRGGYKGYGLGVLVDLLTSVLAGGLYGPLISGLWDATAPSDLGHVFLALNPAAFGPRDAFHERARDLIRRLKVGERVPGVDEILVAGEKERRAADDARLHGVRLYHSVARALDDLGQRFGLDDLPTRAEGPTG